MNFLVKFLVVALEPLHVRIQSTSEFTARKVLGLIIFHAHSVKPAAA